MYEKTLAAFFADRFPMIAGYLLNCFILILFFCLSTNSQIDILYPSMLSAFILVIVLFFQWMQFRGYYKAVERMVDQPDFQLRAITHEQRKHYRILKQIHKVYLQQIEGIKAEGKSFKRFLAQWVHNMKSPVSVIKLIVGKAEEDPEHAQKALADIRQETNRILEGLDQVLGWIRLDEFSQDYEPTVIDLAEDVRQVINKHKNQFIYHHVYPRFSYAGNPAMILSDSKWNQLMLDQLISNAIKYSAAIGESKYVVFELEEQDGSFCLHINDQGIGIPDHDLKRIFEPFYTGENGRTGRSSTGIGLYICSRIAKGLGHTLDIKSKPGEGTCVSIRYMSPKPV